MFVGHFAAALAAKRAAPRISLGTTFLACQLLDLVWPLLVLAGIERVSAEPDATAFTPLAFESYPWSHSLAMTLVWSVSAFFLVRLLHRTRVEAAIVAAVVFSHWPLDYLTHRPDLPLWPGDASKVGLGLWNSVPATLIVELALFATGIWLYLRASRGAPRGRRWVFWTLILFLTLVYLANAFGPAPAVDTPPQWLASPALALWLVVAWAYWADRRGPSASS